MSGCFAFRGLVIWTTGALLVAMTALFAPASAGSGDKRSGPFQLGLSFMYVVLFAPGSSQLDARGRLVLDEVARAALHPHYPDLAISVAGHTDTTGDAEANRVLSCRRAIAVRDYLVSVGVAADLIFVQGRGESDLAVPTGDGRDHAANRRVVVNVYGGGNVRPEWACAGG